METTLELLCSVGGSRVDRLPNIAVVLTSRAVDFTNCKRPVNCRQRASGPLTCVLLTFMLFDVAKLPNDERFYLK